MMIVQKKLCKICEKYFYIHKKKLIFIIEEVTIVFISSNFWDNLKYKEKELLRTNFLRKFTTFFLL